MMRFLLTVWIAACLVIGASPYQADPGGQQRLATLSALERTLSWLEAHPPDPDRAPLGELGMDLWCWNLYARLHPDPLVRERAAARTKLRLRSLKPEVEETATAVSWWALLLRVMKDQEWDSSLYREALLGIDLDAVLERMTPTTRLWTVALLDRSGLNLESTIEGTVVSEGARSGIERFEPSVRLAYAVYHEIAPVTDLGRDRPRSFTEEQIAFARLALPSLLEVSREAGDTDAVAEVLVAAAILGQHGETFYRDGIGWLLGRQAENGTYRTAGQGRPARDAEQYRHGVLVASWALLESLREPAASGGS